MVIFTRAPHNIKLEVAIILIHLHNKNVFSIKLELTRANLDLLEVAEVGVVGTAGERDTCIKKVDELGGTGQVVLRDGLPATPLGGVCDHDGCQVVPLPT